MCAEREVVRIRLPTVKFADFQWRPFVKFRDLECQPSNSMNSCADRQIPRFGMQTIVLNEMEYRISNSMIWCADREVHHLGKVTVEGTPWST